MSKKFVITENKSDCAITEENGFNSIRITDICVTEDCTEMLKNKADIYYLLVDRKKNQPAEQGILKLAEFMFKNGIEAEIIILPKNKDGLRVSFKDFLSKNGKEAFLRLCEEGLDFVEYKIDGIKNLPQKQRDRMIRKEIFPLISEVDNFKLEHYLTFMKEKFNLNARWIEALRGTIKSIREEAEKEREIKRYEKPEVCVMTVKEKEKALKYLKSNNLISRIKEDMSKIGVIGEDINKIALYLFMLTRKFKNPIHAVLFAKTSSGKSHLVNSVAELVPDEDKFILSSASAKSLNYLDSFKEKVFVVQEIHGIKEIEETIRIMQSEGKLTRIYPLFDKETGEFKTVKKEVECQASVITTTTNLGIHPENSTRIFEMNMDESKEQTDKIIEFAKQKTSLKWLLKEEGIKKIKKLHHNIQRLLRNVEVVIPYAKYLEFPSSSTRQRRDIERFLNLIKSVAFLRQYQKKEHKEGHIKYIKADIEDYKIAHMIGNELLRNSFNNFSETTRKILMICAQIEWDRTGIPFFKAHIKEYADIFDVELPSEQTLNAALNYLIDEGLLTKECKGNSPSYKSRVLPKEIPKYYSKFSGGILTPDELKEKIKSEGGEK